MFNKFKRFHSYPGQETESAHVLPAASAEQTAEWEEVANEHSAYADGELPEFQYYDEPQPQSAAQPQLFSRPAESANTAAIPDSSAAIDLEGGVIDPSEFPALRMAFASDEPQPEQQQESSSSAPLDEYTMEMDSEGRISWLIKRYAELDEAEETAEDDSSLPESAASDELPELFRFEPSSNTDGFPTDENNVSQEEPSMEEILEYQQDLSGELFDYLDTIESKTVESSLRQEQERTVIKTKPYDPYNMEFNNRFHEEDEERREAPEIAIRQKYDFHS